MSHIQLQDSLQNLPDHPRHQLQDSLTYHLQDSTTIATGLSYTLAAELSLKHTATGLSPESTGSS